MKSLLEADGNIVGTITNILSNKPNKLVKKSSDRNFSNNNRYLNGSISNASKDLIMTFPVLCDNSLPASTASMISKANERNVVTMLQLLFSAMSINSTNGRDVIASVHKNINTNLGVDDVIDALDNFVASNTNESAKINERELNNVIREMVECLKRNQKSFPENSLSETSLNEYTVLNINGNTVIREDYSSSRGGYDYNQRRPSGSKLENPDKDKEKDIFRKATKFTRETRDKDGKVIDSDTYYDDSSINKDPNVISHNSVQLLDTDIKKANELAPTLMIVQYNELDNDPSHPGSAKIFQKTNFVAGVKSRLIAVDSMDIVERMVAKNKTAINFLNFVRATTGEIHLIKDFLLAVDQAKINAKNASKHGQAARMWQVLELRSAKNARNKVAKSGGNDASAITSLVLSQETVNFLKTQYDFDIENMKNANMILEAYNLLAIFIADESIEVVKSLYVGNDSYETIAYTYMNRENNNSMDKKVINLIGQMNRR